MVQQGTSPQNSLFAKNQQAFDLKKSTVKRPNLTS